MCDFGHGLISDTTIAVLKDNAPFLAVNAQSNSANFGFNLITRYRDVDFVCIDQPEARLAFQDKVSPVSDLIKTTMVNDLACEKIIITMGKEGCCACGDGHTVDKLPGLTASIVDTVGAGDAFFAITSAFICKGMSVKVAAFLGNVAGAIKVGIVGHRSSVDKVSFAKFLRTLMS